MGDIMIKGIGIDIIEIKRAESQLNNDAFMKRYFTENECKYIFEKAKPAESAAAIFSAKESVAKALGTGFRGFSPIDIEILHDDAGKPYVVLSEKALSVAKSKNINKFHLSLSHSKENAISYVIAEGDE